MQHGGWAYILANKRNGTTYVGVTSDLIGRIAKHKSGYYPKSFTARYGVHMLVYYEYLPTIVQAIAREKQLKGGSREKKLMAIESMNPDWRDLYDDVVAEAEGRKKE